MQRTKHTFLKQNEIYILIIFTFLSLVLWNTYFVYPIKLFVVLIHEISHAVMAVLSGGNVKSIYLDSNLSGNTQTEGGSLILISFAGYLGSLIIGLLLFLSGDKKEFGKWFTTLLSLLILISSINLITEGTIVFFSLLVASLLFISPRYFNPVVNSLLLKFVGLVSIFYVVTDIKDDLITSTIRETDTQIVEYITGIPALLIGMVWLIISIITAVWIIKRIVKK